MKNQAIVPLAPTHPGSSLISVSSALGGIVLLILFVAWVAKRFGFTGVRNSGKKTLQVSASASVGPRERVVIVDVENARLVLGVTASQITHLHTLPPAAVNEQPVAQNGHTEFQSLMKNLLKRDGKKTS